MLFELPEMLKVISDDIKKIEVHLKDAGIFFNSAFKCDRGCYINWNIEKKRLWLETVDGAMAMAEAPAADRLFIYPFLIEYLSFIEMEIKVRTVNINVEHYSILIETKLKDMKNGVNK